MFAVWPVATDEKGMFGAKQCGVASGHRKKMVLANSFEKVFVCGRRPQCMYKKPYGRISSRTGLLYQFYKHRKDKTLNRRINSF